MQSKFLLLIFTLLLGWILILLVVTVMGAETIQGRKLLKEIRYLQYGIRFLIIFLKFCVIKTYIKRVKEWDS